MFRVWNPHTHMPVSSGRWISRWVIHEVHFAQPRWSDENNMVAGLMRWTGIKPVQFVCQPVDTFLDFLRVPPRTQLFLGRQDSIAIGASADLYRFFRLIRRKQKQLHQISCILLSVVFLLFRLGVLPLQIKLCKESSILNIKMFPILLWNLYYKLNIKWKSQRHRNKINKAPSPRPYQQSAIDEFTN